jgi:hypothetical protein
LLLLLAFQRLACCGQQGCYNTHETVTVGAATTIKIEPKDGAIDLGFKGTKTCIPTLHGSARAKALYLAMAALETSLIRCTKLDIMNWYPRPFNGTIYEGAFKDIRQHLPFMDGPALNEKISCVTSESFETLSGKNSLLEIVFVLRMTVSRLSQLLSFRCHAA